MTMIPRSNGALDRATRPLYSVARFALALCVLALGAHVVHADRYEAQWSARPLAGMARLREEGSSGDERALVGGLSLGLSYGLSNRLDLGIELVALTTATTTFGGMSILLDGGVETRLPLTRRAATAMLLLGPTWRAGVGWVRVISVAAGGGVRVRSAGRFPELDLSPAEKAAMTALDLGATVRIGLERRLNRRLTIGAYVSALASWSPSAPVLPVATVALGISYVHYPPL